MGYNAVGDYVVYLHSFSRRWLPNLRNPVKFADNSNL